MAGDWLKMEMELSDKPEVHYIAGALSLDPDAVVGKLFRVWCWFNKHTVDGNALGVTYSLVDRITSVSGFGEAMAFSGWLEQRDKTLHMPHFEYHTSESSKKRALTAKRVANHKEKTNAVGNAIANAVSVTSALPREEKRRDKQAASSFVLPEWVSKEDWSSFEESRKKLRKPMTDRARTLVLTELARLRDAGNDPSTVLSQSVRKGWLDVFPVKPTELGQVSGDKRMVM